MTEAEISKKLMQKAGALLGRRGYSRGQLRRKLLGLAGEDLIDRALDKLEELRLLNDSEYAYNFALYRMCELGWGPLKVMDALRRREVPTHLGELAIERVYRESDATSLLSRQLQKHATTHGLPCDRKGIQKLISYLRRRGFRDEAIRDALQRHVPSAAWHTFEIGD